MTSLTIVPNYEKKRLKLVGTVAAGEHVAVTVVGGGDWTQGGTLRLRALFGGKTVAVFPYYTEQREVDGQTVEADAWGGTEDATCELNLNTIQAEKLLHFGGECLWVLDDPANHTLYGTGEFYVNAWPKHRPVDVPYDLDNYPDLVKELSGDVAELSAQLTLLDQNKVDKVAGKGLSTNDYTTAEKTKLSGVEDGAQANVGVEFTQAEKTKLGGIADSANNYVLPPATVNTLGGVKQGTGCEIAADGTLNVTGGGSSVEIDPTLSQQGAAADSKAVGDALLKKLDGEAAYPAWSAASYPEGQIVWHAGKAWIALNDAVPADEPGDGSTWLEYDGTLYAQIKAKQDALSQPQLAAVNSGATAAKVATWDGYAAQIAQKADTSDLPYALVTPGEWEFSGLPSGATNGNMSFDEEGTVWTLSFKIDGDTQEVSAQAPSTALSVAFTVTGEVSYIVTATRASLPGHLLDRAVNKVSVTDATQLTLPALVNAGKARDLLVRLEISGFTVPTITISPDGNESVTYETDGDEFPVPDEAGIWLYSFTETAAHTFAVSLKKVNAVTQGGS